MHHGEAKLSEELDSSSRRKNDFCARSGGLDVGPKGEFTESEATEFSGASKPPVRLKLGTEHALGEGARVGTEATRCRDKIQVEPGWEIENEWGVVPAAISKSDGVVRLKEDEAVRLREITCGLLANACTHRNLRYALLLCFSARGCVACRHLRDYSKDWSLILCNNTQKVLRCCHALLSVGRVSSDTTAMATRIAFIYRSGVEIDDCESALKMSHGVLVYHLSLSSLEACLAILECEILQ